MGTGCRDGGLYLAVTSQATAAERAGMDVDAGQAFEEYVIRFALRFGGDRRQTEERFGSVEFACPMSAGE